MRVVRAAASIAALLVFLFSGHAQVPTSPTAPVAAPPATPPAATPTTPPSPSGAHPLTPTDLESFFDGVLPLQLERSDVAGAAVLVMKDGNVQLQKGYGYADLKSKTAR